MKAVEYGKENRDVIVLLHGGGLSWWNYQEAAEMLSDRFHVVLPILDGHSGSDASFLSIETNAREIIAYIDEHFGGRVCLMGGLSLGGQILADILSLRNHICDYAVIESALALPMKCTASLIKPAFSLAYPLIRKRWFARLQFRSLHIKPSLFEAYYRDTAPLTRSDLISFLSANADYRLRASLRACKARTLVLAGSKETPVMKKSARLIAEAIPDSQLTILKGLRHGDLSINHAQRYAETILRLTGR